MAKALKVTGITVLLFIFQLTASRFGSYFAHFFHSTSIDPDGLFMQLSIHHVVQMIVALMGMLVISTKIRGKEFMLKPKYKKSGVINTLIFTGVILAYYVIVYIAGSYTRTIAVYEYELNSTNVLGTLGFQLLPEN